MSELYIYQNARCNDKHDKHSQVKFRNNIISTTNSKCWS